MRAFGRRSKPRVLHLPFFLLFIKQLLDTLSIQRKIIDFHLFPHSNVWLAVVLLAGREGVGERVVLVPLGGLLYHRVELEVFKWYSFSGFFSEPVVVCVVV